MVHLGNEEEHVAMRIAVIGGTGIDDLPEFARGQRVDVATRFGSALMLRTHFADTELVFVPRHGPDHAVPPSLVNYRAQVAALKKIGITRVIGLCAVGSLIPDLPPGSLAVLADFIDLTRRRTCTFFDEPGGPIAHTDFTEPYCPEISAALTEACHVRAVLFEPRAVYLGVEGPRYETPAEIKLYASWGAHVVGMTNVPEVVLAREAGLCYGALAIVSNLACGLSPGRLSHEEVRNTVRAAAEQVVPVLRDAIARIPVEPRCTCQANTALVV